MTTESVLYSLTRSQLIVLAMRLGIKLPAGKPDRETIRNIIMQKVDIR